MISIAPGDMLILQYTGPVTYLLPVVAIVLGVLVLSESVTGIVRGGIALVLAGVALTRHQAKPVTSDSKPS